MAPESDNPSRPRLKRNISWLLLGTSVFAFFQWLYLISIARVLGPEAAGSYALCQSLIYPIFALCNLQIRRLIITDLSERISIPSYVFFAILSSTVAGALAITVFLASGDRDLELILLFHVLAAAKGVEALFDVSYGYQQRIERMPPVAVSLLLRNTPAFPVFLILLLAGMKLWHAAIAIPATWILTLLAFDARRVRLNVSQEHFRPNANWTPIKDSFQIAHTGVPLGLVIFFNQLHVSVPRLALDWKADLTTLGIFAPIASLITVGALLSSAANNAALPRLTRYHRSSNVGGFVLLTQKLVALAAMLGATALTVGTIFAESIIDFLLGTVPVGADSVLAVVMVAGMLWYMSAATGTALTATRAFSLQLGVAVITVITTTVISLLLVPKWGALGAASGLAGGALVKFVVQSLLIWRKTLGMKASA